MWLLPIRERDLSNDISSTAKELESETDYYLLNDTNCQSTRQGKQRRQLLMHRRTQSEIATIS